MEVLIIHLMLALVLIQDSNNKYVIGGTFTHYNGILSNRIIRLNSEHYFMNLPTEFSRSGNIFTGINLEMDIMSSGGIISLNERVDDNIISCDTKYFIDNNQTINYNYIPYIEPQPNEDFIRITIDSIYPKFDKIENLNTGGIFNCDVKGEIRSNESTQVISFHENLSMGEEAAIPTNNIPDFTPNNIKLTEVININDNTPINFSNTTINLKNNVIDGVIQTRIYNILSAKLIRQNYNGVYKLEVELNYPIYNDVILDTHLYWGIYDGFTEGINFSKLKSGTASTYVHDLIIPYPYEDYDSQSTISLDWGNTYNDCNMNYEYNTQTRDVIISSLV